MKTQNVPDDMPGFRITTTLAYVMNYLGTAGLVFTDGAWRLKCPDKVGRYEPGRGQKEPLSEWCLRQIDRLAGRVTYATWRSPASTRRAPR